MHVEDVENQVPNLGWANSTKNAMEMVVAISPPVETSLPLGELLEEIRKEQRQAVPRGMVVNGNICGWDNVKDAKKRIHRNSNCPCGSGLKYKKCCHGKGK